MSETKRPPDMSPSEQLHALRELLVAERREIVLQTLLYREGQPDSPLAGDRVAVIQHQIKAVDEALEDESELDPPKSVWEQLA